MVTMLLRCAGAALAIAACDGADAVTIAPRGALTTQYLPDYEYRSDSAQGFATSNHLVVFNPGARDASVSIRILFEDQPPKTVPLRVPAMSSVETNQAKWPVVPNSRFGIVLTSDEPVIAQATIGWTNTFNDYSDTARARDGGKARETALSYLAHQSTATRWMLADGLVINSETLFIKESEYALLLNPSADTAHVVVRMASGGMREIHQLDVPPDRVRAVTMDSLVPANQHYGAVIESSRPIVANWRRTVQWRDQAAMMAFWSVPMVGLNAVATER
jgi:hypothetical protein